ncbi:MAG: VanW family protein, partial [bacterium]|nr:VanW family protein [bacterium]
MNSIFYNFAVFAHRTARRLRWLSESTRYSVTRSEHRLSNLVTTHSSLLLRKLAGTDPVLQRNKVKSLGVAAAKINGVILQPGEVFSFWRLVGKPSKKRGFLLGLQLSFGELTSMIGGGLCQVTNLLHWMVLHTPLTVIERHRHSTDPFPDYK